MSADDADRWDARHASGGRPAARAPEALALAGLDDAGALARSTGGGTRALDVACGTGAATLWLAERGWSVTALDVSPVAVARLRDAAGDAGVAERVDALVVDLDHGLPDGLGGLDLVVCQRFRDPDVHAGLLGVLAPGGLCAVTVLSESGADDPGPFHAPAGELARTFERADLERLAHHEGDGTESIVVRLRPG